MNPPMKTTNAGEEALEKVEYPDRTDADKIEDGPFDTQVRKGLVQALEDSVASLEIGFLHEALAAQLGGIG